MRLVLDTNVLVAAFIAHGACYELLEHAAINHQLVLSRPILDEFQEVLERKFKFSPEEVDEAIRLLSDRAMLVEPDKLSTARCRDPKDDMVLATALAGECSCIVSGDRDLTDLKEYAGIHIMTPNEFWGAE